MAATLYSTHAIIFAVTRIPTFQTCLAHGHKAWPGLAEMCHVARPRLSASFRQADMNRPLQENVKTQPKFADIIHYISNTC